MKKGFFQIGLVVLVASFAVAGLLINKLKFQVSNATNACGSNTDITSCNKACSPVKADGKSSFKCKWLSATSKCVESANQCDAEITKFGNCNDITSAVNVYYCKGMMSAVGGEGLACSKTDPLPVGAGWDSANKKIVGKFCGTIQVDQRDAPPGTTFCSLIDSSGCKTDSPPVITPSPTPTIKPTFAPTATPTVRPTVQPTKTPVCTPTVKPTKSPSPSSTPTSSPVPQCNSTCSSDSACPSGLTCYKKYGIGTGYCRNVSCNKNSNCICSTPSPTPTVKSTFSPTPTATPIEKSYLKICKFKDENGNGNKDSEDSGISWNFNYKYDDTVRVAGNHWWNIFDKGCVKVEVPAGKNITVNEEGRGGWELTAIYANSSKVSGGNYIYNSEAGKTKEVWFLNKLNPQSTPTVGEPNSCNGTCGSNSNCQSGLYCYQGYCRNPNNPQSTSCTEPQVLGTSAPVTVLPKTGSSSMLYALGFMAMGATGIYLYKKFKLV